MNPRDFDPGPLAHVEHHVEGGRSTLVFVRHLRHSPAKVWASLTDPAKLRQWAPFDPDRDLATPGPAVLRMRDGQTVEEYPAKVLRAEAPRLLEYTWGEDLLRWELAPDTTGTTLTLRHTVDGADWVPRTAAGWHLCFVVAERLLDGHPIGPIVGRDAMNYGWQVLHDAYAKALGIEGKGFPEEAFTAKEKDA